jgi:ABC-2 type transport system permease protein
MNLKRIWTLVKTEIIHGPKDVVVIMALVLPVLLAFFVSLAFGDIFTDAQAGFTTPAIRR